MKNSQCDRIKLNNLFKYTVINTEINTSKRFKEKRNPNEFLLKYLQKANYLLFCWAQLEHRAELFWIHLFLQHFNDHGSVLFDELVALFGVLWRQKAADLFESLFDLLL